MDEIVGHDRTPTLADLPNLPYLQAAWTESLRWRPPVPLCGSTFTVYQIAFSLVGLTVAFNIGIPHKSNTEDVYNGYRIPRGSLIFANVACVLVYLVWRVAALSATDYHRFMLNDPSVWPEPRSFKPERFLDTLAPGQFDPQAVIFGFGRRLVPHPIHFARATTLNPT